MGGSSAALSCFRVEITGIVQGVGFRPFIYRLAHRHDLKGYVLNHDRGVTAEVEGAEADLERFFGAISAELPPAARVDSIERQVVPVQGYHRFEIRASTAGSASKYVPVSPDLALCEDCRRELWDPEDRRYFYPFINCTNCGPRLTITRDVPYDRPLTTMAPFAMCASCQAEYDNPENRRFHAQPNACPDCGPRIALFAADGAEFEAGGGAKALVEKTAELLREGKIVAVKGVGGFHLVCDALNEAAVVTLRTRKLREKKALAVMFADLGAAREYVSVSEAEAGVLGSKSHPIVLLQKQPGRDVAASVAPGNRFLGVMLPYTPLHELLVRTFGGPLVMTSGNLSDEPIAFKDADARERLALIADWFLVNNREIHVRCDDSVLRVLREKPYFYRRSRGFVPEGLRVRSPFPVPILGVGAQLKNTICLTRGDEAILSHHIGDLENLATMESFEHAIRHFKALFNIEPQVIAHDLHPDYLNTKWVGERFGELARAGRVVGVQHHHAHIAACLGENHHRGRAIGLALDGTGFGTDGTVWGGEVLLADVCDFTRVGRLRTVKIAGGEHAIRQPWRIALAYLFAAGLSLEECLRLPFLARIGAPKARVIWQLLEKGLNCYETSSCGRLFDAVSALADVVPDASYEGHAAIELENALQAKLLTASPDWAAQAGYPFAISEAGGLHEIDWRPAIAAIARDLHGGATAEQISLKFHRGLVGAFVEVCKKLSMLYDIETVALSGGCFLNEYLVREMFEKLSAQGLNVLVHREVPTNDGGIAFGQCIVAAEKCRKG